MTRFLCTMAGFRKHLDTREGKLEVVRFIEGIRSQCGSAEEYASVCAKAEAERPLDGAAIAKCFALLVPFMERSRPGHDLGHFYRDFLAALTIVGSDPMIRRAKYRCDVIAGLLAGSLHDCAVAVKARYADNQWEAGHAEVGAWLVHELLQEIVPPNQLALVCYCIAAHTHSLKPISVTNPVSAESYERLPYDTELIYNPQGSVVGLGPWIARFADRLDTNGASHLARHLVAMADSVE